MKYRYYENKKEVVDDISVVQKALSISDKSSLIDSKYLPTLEAAENGDILAKCVIAEIFWNGEGAEKNYEMANYYTEQILDESGNYGSVAVFEARKNKAHLEFSFHNYEESLKWYLDAILYQQDNISVEDWDFTVYTSLENLLSKISTSELA